jgi:hypothetical protein
MKAISILQPWATLIVLGHKHFETRSWATKHRGPLLIHSGRRYTTAAQSLSELPPFSTHVPPGPLPLGQLIGYCTLDACLPTEQALPEVSPDEHTFGDYRSGRHAWRLTNPHPFAHPIHWQGQLGLFTIPDELLSIHFANDADFLSFLHNAQNPPQPLDT